MPSCVCKRFCSHVYTFSLISETLPSHHSSKDKYPGDMWKKIKGHHFLTSVHILMEYMYLYYSKQVLHQLELPHFGIRELLIKLVDFSHCIVSTVKSDIMNN